MAHPLTLNGMILISSIFSFLCRFLRPLSLLWLKKLITLGSFFLRGPHSAQWSSTCPTLKSVEPSSCVVQIRSHPHHSSLSYFSGPGAARCAVTERPLTAAQSGIFRVSERRAARGHWPGLLGWHLPPGCCCGVCSNTTDGGQCLMQQMENKRICQPTLSRDITLEAVASFFRLNLPTVYLAVVVNWHHYRRFSNFLGSKGKCLPKYPLRIKCNCGCGF